MKWLGAICVALSMSAICFAEPPTIDIRSEIEAKGDVVTFTPKTDAKTVIYIGLSGVDPLPPEILKDPRTFVLYTRGLKVGYYKFIAIAVKDNEVTRQDFIIKKGTPPPTPIPPDPTPEPEPEPIPNLDDAPVSTTGLYVAFINESGNRVTQPQFNVMYGATSTKWLDANTVNVNGNPQWRIIDQNNIALSEPWKNILTRKRETIPWIVVIANKKYIYEGPLSPTITANGFIELISKFKPVAKKPIGYRSMEPDKAPINSGVVVSQTRHSEVVSGVATIDPFSLRKESHENLVQGAIGLTTIVLTADDWKQQFQDTEVESTITIVAPLPDVRMTTGDIQHGGIKYSLPQYNGCVGGNCPVPQSVRNSNSWYPGKILGR